MSIQKIYIGWIIEIDNVQFTIISRYKLRSTTWYILKSKIGKHSLDRRSILNGLNGGTFKYIEVRS